MNQKKVVDIYYFTDILCIWAYVAQIRMDELKKTFGEQIRVHQKFVQVFGSIESKIQGAWAKNGGIEGYGKHVQEVATGFKHIQLHDDIWHKNTPTSSMSCHLYLKAVQLLGNKGQLDSNSDVAIWAMREAFFKNLVDISSAKGQQQVTESLGLPWSAIQALICSGEAFAALAEDAQLVDKYSVKGSPTLVMNEGRQVLYGNVGYKVMEANVQELLNHSERQVSWC
ncbi:MAG: disulfide bond formation protein DsbA [Piscirickettsiaceae bacterium]|nr:MAG: disulfide bond formation protein DsbA [Piscirickettsiaceae bacterium]